MSTTPNLEDRLRSHYATKADELRLSPMDFDDLFDTQQLVEVTSLRLVSPTRTALFAAAALVVIALVGGGILLRSRTVTPADTTPTTLSAPPPTTTAAIATASRPLALSTGPQGLQLVGQGVRPAGGENVRAAVFVKRDAKNNITERVIARFGAIGLYEGSLLTPPANLSTATSGSLSIDQPGRTLRVEYGLGTAGNLLLEAYHTDERTNGALSDEMQQIAATLQVNPGHDLGTAAPLPDGWTLATVGVEPEQAVPSFYQAFEVDSADGGAKIMIDNRMITDAGYPYWAMAQTLQPVEVRGHSGYVTTQDYFPMSPDPSAPAVADPTNAATILIWEEAPGHWVTMWVADNTTDQAIALANGLVPESQDQWHMPGAVVPTTTTTLSSVPSP